MPCRAVAPQQAKCRFTGWQVLILGAVAGWISGDFRPSKTAAESLANGSRNTSYRRQGTVRAAVSSEEGEELLGCMSGRRTGGDLEGVEGLKSGVVKSITTCLHAQSRTPMNARG